MSTNAQTKVIARAGPDLRMIEGEGRRDHWFRERLRELLASDDDLSDSVVVCPEIRLVIRAGGKLLSVGVLENGKSAILEDD